MILRIKNGNTVTPVTGKVALDSTAKVSVTPDTGNAVSIAAPVIKPFTDWYDEHVALRQQQILNGGGDFSRGLLGVYIAPIGKPYIKTIQNIEPDDNGNIELLPSVVVDIYPGAEEGQLVVNRLPRFSAASYYKELDMMLWCLYHAYVYLNYRMCCFDPTQPELSYGAGNSVAKIKYLGRCMGTLPNYMANLAHWNHYVWLSHTVSDVSAVGVNISIDLGWVNSICSASNVIMDLEIVRDAATDSNNAAYTEYMTVYEIDIIDDITAPGHQSLKPGSNNYTITKYNGSTAGSSVKGTGVLEEYEEWDKIKIHVPVGNMNPYDRIQILYSLGLITLPGVPVRDESSGEITGWRRANQLELLPSSKVCGFTLNFKWTAGGEVLFAKSERVEATTVTTHEWQT